MSGSLSSEIGSQSCEPGLRRATTLRGNRAFDRAAPVGEV